MTTILILKAFHIIGAVAWFAGLFYLVRIFVYHVEAEEKPEPEKKLFQEQYNLMEWRVYKAILTPAMIFTWTCGTIMLCIYGMDWIKEQSWIHLKLLFIVLLSGYQHYCKGIIKKLEKGTNTLTSIQLRMFNEVATLFLIAIVLLAVLRSFANFGMVLGGTLLLGVVFYLIIKALKKKKIT